jgi:hypothetical protein
VEGDRGAWERGGGGQTQHLPCGRALGAWVRVGGGGGEYWTLTCIFLPFTFSRRTKLQLKGSDPMKNEGVRKLANVRRWYRTMANDVYLLSM